MRYENDTSELFKKIKENPAKRSNITQNTDKDYCKENMLRLYISTTIETLTQTKELPDMWEASINYVNGQINSLERVLEFMNKIDL